MYAPPERQARCCPTHSSHDELVEHLHAEFSDLDPAAVVREVAHAVTAGQLIGLDRGDDWLLLCELVARHQLLLLSGRAEDGARLDPQAHPSRRSG